MVGMTNDGGDHWRFVELKRERDVATAASFVDATHGWVVCAPYDSRRYPSTILRTTNGGRTWKLQDMTKRQVTLRDVAFVDRHRGWAVGQSAGYKGGDLIILTTRNGGRTWSRQNLSAPWYYAGIQVAFADRRHGWIACGPLVFATTDGGLHWRAQRPGTQVVALAFTDASHGWAAADSADRILGGGGMLTTTTGGFAGAP
jgi:photosystem II stability/assembly factor-like uncharacterized protein